MVRLREVLRHPLPACRFGIGNRYPCPTPHRSTRRWSQQINRSTLARRDYEYCLSMGNTPDNKILQWADNTFVKCENSKHKPIKT